MGSVTNMRYAYLVNFSYLMSFNEKLQKFFFHFLPMTSSPRGHEKALTESNMQFRLFLISRSISPQLTIGWLGDPPAGSGGETMGIGSSWVCGPWQKMTWTPICLIAKPSPVSGPTFLPPQLGRLAILGKNPSSNLTSASSETMFWIRPKREQIWNNARKVEMCG